MDKAKIDIVQLRAEVSELYRRHQSGDLSTHSLAFQLTHMNFDERFAYIAEHKLDPHLSRIIEDLAPDLEWQPAPDIIISIANEIAQFGDVNSVDSMPLK